MNGLQCTLMAQSAPLHKVSDIAGGRDLVGKQFNEIVGTYENAIIIGVAGEKRKTPTKYYQKERESNVINNEISAENCRAVPILSKRERQSNVNK